MFFYVSYYPTDESVGNSNPQPVTRDPQHATRNPQPVTRNPQPKTHNILLTNYQQ